MDEIKRNGSGYVDPTAYKVLKKIGNGGANMQIKRGDIFEVRTPNGYMNTVLVVSSDDRSGMFVSTLKVVDETKSYYAVPVVCRGQKFVDCDLVAYNKKDNFEEYIRTATDEEMKLVDAQIMRALGLIGHSNTDVHSEVKAKNMEIDDLKMKLEGVERELDEKHNMLIEAQKQITDAQEHNERLMAQNNFLSDCDEVVRLKAQIEVLERQNERLLDRLIG